ncbi:phosphoadenylyl-sulfate reductase [Promicromonospora citrea]|uniref:Adenosine 5'-phosphosulfate reductase n=1 Tax=Promicromonospora citrea TaxID=43677 RepID=A0A8H9GEF7_9MICO|nr:phosphoadenylyl-sulfate reductase [Promicromonospora citrea]NNH54316.1 phosphoadenylyl-sulfate reductase [Promicromonospora citrea]GGM13149.1 phosphoadenosine phosphosulfate reductase [Promicromonospora citrea]
MTTTEPASALTLTAPASASEAGLNPRLARVRARAAARERIRAARPSARARRRKRTPEELRAVVERGQAQLNASEGTPEADAHAVIAWAVREFGPYLAVASSMQDTVLSHLVSEQFPFVDVLFGDTGYHFAETLGTRGAAEIELDITVIDVRPALSVAEQDAVHGPRLHDRDPEACCAMRKVAPMREALTDYEAWATGVRRSETAARANAPLVSWDERNGVVKINPIAAWTDEQVAAYAQRHGLVINPLLTDGYPSVGCEPCTARPLPGQDARSGRWAGRDKDECGLHV